MNSGADPWIYVIKEYCIGEGNNVGGKVRWVVYWICLNLKMLMAKKKEDKKICFRRISSRTLLMNELSSISLSRF